MMKKNKRTFNQQKNLMLNIKRWVASHRNLIPKIELKAFDLMCDDFISNNYNKPLIEHLDDCLNQIYTWDLYKIYKDNNYNSQLRVIEYYKKLSKLNVKILLISKICDVKTFGYLYRLIRRDKMRIKKLIDDKY